MAINRGKQFESVIKKCFERVENCSVDRLHDQMSGFKGSKNICDFIVYKYPRQFYIECKAVHGSILPFSDITDNQWKGLLKKSEISGVIAGIICWWIDKNITKFIPIQELENFKNFLPASRSIRYDLDYMGVLINGTKKRVFFDYDMEEFLNGYY